MVIYEMATGHYGYKNNNNMVNLGVEIMDGPEP